MNIGGFEIDEKINIFKKELTLNGVAVRSKFFIQTYIISIYAEKSITQEQDAIDSNIERSLRMQIITPLATPKVVSENIENAMKAGLGNSYLQHKSLIDEVRSVIEKSAVQYQDIIDIYYAKNGDFLLFKNGNEIYKNADGTLLITAIYNMYVGKNPKDKKIKSALLKGF
ncbi:MAG: chalcone isomerase family protein [Bacteroidetes bacterium]|nr:chalcone isomerase family protein [Bacteroidota bacterium]